MSKPTSYITLLRPQQWAKNLFLFAPLVFSQHLFDVDYAEAAALAFGVFCLLTSSVYVINDIADRESDRLHPLKQRRAIASGVVSVKEGVVLVLGLLVIVVFALAHLNIKFLAAAATYFVINMAYSFGLKRVILVDVFVIATGFMLRVLAGAFAIAVVVSPWLILCTLFVSVFLAVSKRRAEILLQPTATDFSSRPVLREYDTAIADQMMTIAAAGMAISYALYTVAERTVSMFGTENLIFTTIFVIFGIFRYLYLVKRHQTDDNPTHLLLTDAAMLANMLAWFVACVLIIYFNELKSWIL